MLEGYVKSWTIGLSPNADLVNTMLKGTIAKLHENEKPIIHSVEEHIIDGQNGQN